MIRRYDMSRSDNAPFTGKITYPCESGAGRIFVYTGFAVSSAIVAPVGLPSGARLFVDTSFGKESGFDVTYENMPIGSSRIEFSFQAS